MNHFISLDDVSGDQIREILNRATALRDERRNQRPHASVLEGRTLAMIFEKPSLRTRVSFEQAIVELGGHAIVLGDAEVGLGRRESAADVARVLNGMVHGIIARVYEHQKLLDMAQVVSFPVINALSDQCHPVQVLADAMTLIDEFGTDLSSLTVAYIGDGNNVTRSLATLCAKLRIRLTVAAPRGYDLEEAFVEGLRADAPGFEYEATHDPAAAVKRADAVYTDTWVSMGQERQAEERRVLFADYQINEKLMAEAPSRSIVLHCLPAYRGKEITDEIMDGPRSRVFLQAHNRLHAQKGLLAEIYAPRECA